MDESIHQRVMEIAAYMLSHRATVRQAAQVFGLCKSSVHKDLTQRLPQIHPAMALEVAELMRYNKSVRHLRGGESTRRMYQQRAHL